MKKESFFSYGRTCRPILFLFLTFAVIWGGVLWLYRLPAEAVLYASALCVPVALFAFGIGGIAFDRRLRRLQRLKEQACVELSDLPEPRDAIDATYAAMLRLLWEEQRCLIQASRMQNAELLDYYTLWAHQIKTPIAAMRLLLQTQETDESAELRDALFQIEQYVEMVMQFLRTESMTGDWVVRTYDLDEIVRRAVHKYARQFIRKRLKLDYCPLRCAVLTDEKWLGFVIEQLLSNALKYTQTGTITLRMAEDAPKVLLMEDTGIGILPEDLPRVFERGFTGANGRIDQQSTGIGLYLCHRIMEKLSHGLTISSVSGKGTQVRIRLDREALPFD